VLPGAVVERAPLAQTGWFADALSKTPGLRAASDGQVARVSVPESTAGIENPARSVHEVLDAARVWWRLSMAAALAADDDGSIHAFQVVEADPTNSELGRQIGGGMLQSSLGGLALPELGTVARDEALAQAERNVARLKSALGRDLAHSEVSLVRIDEGRNAFGIMIELKMDSLLAAQDYLGDIVTGLQTGLVGDARAKVEGVASEACDTAGRCVAAYAAARRGGGAIHLSRELDVGSSRPRLEYEVITGGPSTIGFATGTNQESRDRVVLETGQDDLTVRGVLCAPSAPGQATCNVTGPPPGPPLAISRAGTALRLTLNGPASAVSGLFQQGPTGATVGSSRPWRAVGDAGRVWELATDQAMVAGEFLTIGVTYVDGSGLTAYTPLEWNTAPPSAAQVRRVQVNERGRLRVSLRNTGDAAQTLDVRVQLIRRSRASAFATVTVRLPRKGSRTITVRPRNTAARNRAQARGVRARVTLSRAGRETARELAVITPSRQ
jgi:hypothetical protein